MSLTFPVIKRKAAIVTRNVSASYLSAAQPVPQVCGIRIWLCTCCASLGFCFYRFDSMQYEAVEDLQRRAKREYAAKRSVIVQCKIIVLQRQHDKIPKFWSSLQFSKFTNPFFSGTAGEQILRT